nr:porin [Mitsuaria sp. WAJ17]
MMKKIALVAALAAVSASAFAQSSVTLWGRANVTVESQKVGTGDRKVVVQDNRSRLGVKGQEDLGGGLKVSFALEHGLDLDTGKQTGGTFWNRESSVQLSGAFGAIRLGNWTNGSYFATADYVSMHNHDTGTSDDKLYSGAGWTSVNKVGYFTPNIDGFSGEITMHAGEGADKRAFDLSGNYDQGPLHLGAGYSKQDNQKQYAARALYELGEFTVGGYLQREDIAGATRNIWRLAGMYTMGASEFHVNFGGAGRSAAGAKANQFTLGYNYNLSKRTKVYGFFTKLDNKDNNAGDLNSLAAGIRHNF